MTVIRHEKGPRMSQAVIHNRTVHLAGQVGHGASTAEQTRDMLAQVERLLALSDSGKSLILSAQIWLADMKDFAEMNAVWDAWIDPEHPPARACGELRLASPEYRVEALIVAAQRG
ncbi:RidA family protein [Ramlibacter sp. 2FC]|uniref:RidA family protein n=1 Tax=Ramlibacter sp. 2FC TaxID=2502188 RepID=UPI0010F81352|nr:RidA family protein [Ramlibacter sp. 2FC]